MNIDEIQAGEEMDRLVAEKVMGWTCEDSAIGAAFGPQPFTVVGREDPFLPTINIAHAWEVVEMMSDRLGFTLEKLPSGQWEADFGGFVGLADTAPPAICRAALKAVRA